ncbi:MAG: hypothetical protein ACOC45_03380 [Alkalispirochaetaceae bacterium]
MWIIDATNIRTGGMSNYVHAPEGDEDVRRIPEDNSVELVDGEEDQPRGSRRESRRGGLLHPWQGNEFDEMA